MKIRGQTVYPLKERLERLSRAVPSGCIEWTGTTNVGGYGKLGIGSRSNSTRRLVSAHRLAYEVFVGPVPAGLKVLHRCDNPPCVNPDHLFLGTQQDNIADMMRKGRNRSCPPRGEDHPRAKLTWNAVRAIRNAPPEVSNKELGERLNVSSRTGCHVRRHTTWRIPDPPNTETAR